MQKLHYQTKMKLSKCNVNIATIDDEGTEKRIPAEWLTLWRHCEDAFATSWEKGKDDLQMAIPLTKLATPLNEVEMLQKTLYYFCMIHWSKDCKQKLRKLKTGVWKQQTAENLLFTGRACKHCGYIKDKQQKMSFETCLLQKYTEVESTEKALTVKDKTLKLRKWSCNAATVILKRQKW